MEVVATHLPSSVKVLSGGSIECLNVCTNQTIMVPKEWSCSAVAATGVLAARTPERFLGTTTRSNSVFLLSLGLFPHPTIT